MPAPTLLWGGKQHSWRQASSSQKMPPALRGTPCQRSHAPKPLKPPHQTLKLICSAGKPTRESHPPPGRMPGQEGGQGHPHRCHRAGAAVPAQATGWVRGGQGRAPQPPLGWRGGGGGGYSALLAAGLHTVSPLTCHPGSSWARGSPRPRTGCPTCTPAQTPALPRSPPATWNRRPNNSAAANAALLCPGT